MNPFQEASARTNGIVGNRLVKEELPPSNRSVRSLLDDRILTVTPLRRPSAHTRANVRTSNPWPANVEEGSTHTRLRHCCGAIGDNTNRIHHEPRTP